MMTKSEVAQAFSIGEFEKAYDHINSDAVWTVIEENRFEGKDAIIKNCVQVSEYFKSVTTDFKILNVISEDNKVVINGTAEFLREGKRLSFVSSCDIYEFDDKDLIQKITSYCIESV